MWCVFAYPCMCAMRDCACACVLHPFVHGICYLCARYLVPAWHQSALCLRLDYILRGAFVFNIPCNICYAYNVYMYIHTLTDKHVHIQTCMESWHLYNETQHTEHICKHTYEMYLYIYTCIYIRIQKHTYILIHEYTNTHTHTDRITSIGKMRGNLPSMTTHIHTHIHTRMHASLLAYMHINVHAFTQSNLLQRKERLAVYIVTYNTRATC